MFKKGFFALFFCFLSFCVLAQSTPSQNDESRQTQTTQEPKQMKVSIILKAKVLPGKQGELRSLVTSLQGLVFPEEGCEMYEFYIDGNSFVMLERWADETSLDKHSKTKHFSELIPKMKSYVEGNVFSAEIIKSSDRAFVTL